MYQTTTSKITLGIVLAIGLSNPLVHAAPLTTWDSSWNQFAAEDQSTYFLDPGYGGQLFDAEYLYYQYNSHTGALSIGLQTGFDITGDGAVNYSGATYYTGDLALSFNGATIGDAATYEYAIDFGTYGTDTAGLYAVSTWSDVIYPLHAISNPLAMTSGSLISALALDMGSGIAGAQTSYFVKATFNIADLGLSDLDLNNIDVHWTMSCGNDAIDGYINVPEPGSLLLVGTALLGLVGSRRIKRRA